MDSGKTMIERNAKDTNYLIDLNRAGVAVLEIVTEPQLHSFEESILFMKKIQRLMAYYQVGYADMEDVGLYFFYKKKFC